jgi:hypothetical protein
VPEAVVPATIPHVTTPNRPIVTDRIVPDLSGLRIVQPRSETYLRPAATDLIVIDASGLPPIVPAAPGTPGGILPS